MQPWNVLLVSRPLTGLPATPATAAEDAAAEGRRPLVLQDGWRTQQLDADQPDVAVRAREAGAPDATWFPAPMPARGHETLLARGPIPDPRGGKNAAACT
jgi:hypothetical protein